MEIENDGLLGAWTIGPGGATVALGWEALDDPIPEGHWRWVHLHRDGARSQAWLLDGDIPPDGLAWALLAEDTRPRYTVIEGGGLLMLRGVNLNEGAEPEDMVSLRIFVDEHWIVSVGLRRLLAVEAIVHDIETGAAPPSPGTFVERLVQELRVRVEPVLDDLVEVIEELELEALRDSAPAGSVMRNAFTDARQDAILIRRYLAPQSETLRALSRRPPPWLGSGEKLAEEAAGFERIVEDLDTVRERAAILRDEMSARMAERTNDIMLILSVVSAIFLPIAFITGLLGMNVGGLPLTETRWGFWTVCAALAGMALAAAMILRQMLRRR